MNQNDHFKKTTEANKLINEESNRIITWSLTVIGGSILTIISSGYVNPTGPILYAYAIFAVGWVYLGFSIYYGEKVTRNYIAGITADDENTDFINSIGKEVDNNFGRQLSYFKYGIFTFSAWLILFLVWFIVNKSE
jgi:hypothetical protein